MNARSWITAAFAALALSPAGCTGLSFGENEPGEDTWLDPDPPPPPPDGAAPDTPRHVIGALAVERDEDRVWLVHREDRGSTQRSHLTAVDPITGTAVSVLDVTRVTDRRILFPTDDRALVMGQADGMEHIVLLDTDGLTEIDRTVKSTWYWGTRTSPSGKFVAVADNADPSAPIHLLDTRRLEHMVVPHGGTHLEAMWNHGTDQLIAVSVPELDGPDARILRWNVTSLSEWPQPDLDIVVPGMRWDFLFSFTWIGISPDDRWAVFPLVRIATNEHVLVVLDQSDGTVREVAGRGPVGFTADGSHIVSYGYRDGHAVLYLIDPETLETTYVDTPIEDGIRFFPTRDGNFVVMTSAITNEGPVLVHQVETGASREVPGPHQDLREFVTRPGKQQLWLVDHETLYRLALAGPTLDELGVPFAARHVNILPAADRLALSATQGDSVWLYDMGSESIDMEVALPSTFERTPPPIESASPRRDRPTAGRARPWPRRELGPGAELRLDP